MTSNVRETNEKRSPLHPRATLSRSEVIRIRLDTGCTERTIRAWARGDVLSARTMDLIARAAQKVGVK
jgi:hypothetical protein